MIFSIWWTWWNRQAMISSVGISPNDPRDASSYDYMPDNLLPSAVSFASQNNIPQATALYAMANDCSIDLHRSPLSALTSEFVIQADGRDYPVVKNLPAFETSGQELWPGGIRGAPPSGLSHPGCMGASDTVPVPPLQGGHRTWADPRNLSDVDGDGFPHRVSHTMFAAAGRVRSSLQSDKHAISQHLSSAHNHPFGSGKSTQRCRWAGCTKQLKQESIPRHVLSVHLRMTAMCQACGSSFARHDSLQRHTRNACEAYKVENAPAIRGGSSEKDNLSRA
ncbi:hypothetical protein BU15DRAFT_59913 [Melanogaster broomeanus]|nr:hypothetical protein BU15DRAFT_59913 [Melanogaster broomeanus]